MRVPVGDGGAFAPGKALRIKIVPVGRTGEPVISVENVLRDPAQLIAWAAESGRFSPADGARGGFPGLRAETPADYAGPLLAALDPLIRRTFGLAGPGPRLIGSAFSILTGSPRHLHPMQRLPHIDTHRPGRIALLHYLCDPPYDGTAFFRQEATGIEQVTGENHGRFRAARRRELAAEPPLGYPDRATPGYLQTASFAARLNRLLIYRSCSLHSGLAARGVPLPPDPRTGRLTANIFLDYAAP